jgi:hypothetical protein
MPNKAVEIRFIFYTPFLIYRTIDQQTLAVTALWQKVVTKL